MSNEEHPQGRSPAPAGHSYENGGWQPTPHGEYDPEGTAFVQLPTEDVAHAAPLEAPGHGYVPPMINPLTPNEPPSAPAWPSAQEQTGEYVWHDPSSQPQGAPADGHDTGQWAFPEAEHRTPAPKPQPVTPDATGQWSIPLAGNNLAEETGEYTRAMLQSQWSSAPTTLPGGATAPWATDASATLPGGAPAPWATEPHQHDQHDQHDQHGEHGEPVARRATPPGISTGGPAGSPVADETSASASAEAPVEHTAVADGAHETDRQRPEAAELSGPPEASADEHPSDPGPVEGARATHPAEEHAHPGRPEAQEAGAAPQPATDPAAHSEPAPVEPESTDQPEPSAETEPEQDSDPDAPQGDFDAPTDIVDHRPTDFDTEADAENLSAALSIPPVDEHPPTSYVLRVNGSDRPVTDAWIGESLLYVLRERLGLAGAKDGCSQGECGACNVQVDGRLVASCLVPAATAAGSEVRTVEGLATDGEPSDVQRALAACGAVQCGFCIPGMAMTVHDLLEGNHSPTELETRQALCGNLCRCSGYRGVLDAVAEVVAGREASAAAAAEATEAPGAAPAPEARIPHQASPGAGSVQPHPHDGGMA